MRGEATPDQRPARLFAHHDPYSFAPLNERAAAEFFHCIIHFSIKRRSAAQQCYGIDIALHWNAWLQHRVDDLPLQLSSIERALWVRSDVTA